MSNDPTQPEAGSSNHKMRGNESPREVNDPLVAVDADDSTRGVSLPHESAEQSSKRVAALAPWLRRQVDDIDPLVLGKFGPGPIGTRSGPDQTPRSQSRSGIFLKTLDRLVSGLGIPILPETVSDPVWTGTT